MKRLAPTSKIISELYIQNSKAFLEYLSVLSSVRDALLCGDNPSIPPVVRPAYTERGQANAQVGIRELKAYLEDLNNSDYMKSRGYICSFESSLFAWGLTPVELRHLSCGTVTYYRAFTLKRAVDSEKVSCAKRECYEQLNNVKLNSGSRAPSRKGQAAWNKGADSDAFKLVEEATNGLLTIVDGGYRDKSSPVVLLVNSPGAAVDEMYLVLSNFSNAQTRDSFRKTAQHILDKGKPHPRVSVYETEYDALTAAGFNE